MVRRPAARPSPAARFSLAAAAAACLALASCGAPREAPAYPYVADRPRVLFATADGLSAARPAAAAGANASIAHNASVLTSDGRSIVAAINAFGYARVEAAPPGPAAAAGAGRGPAGAAGVAYRLINVPLRSCLGGLTTGGIWPSGSGFVLQLYRDPFFSGSPADVPERARDAAGTRLLEIGASAGERALPCPPAADGYELFALFPSRGLWLGELRRDGADSVDLAFFEAAGPLDVGSTREVGREVFESALAPLPLSSLQGLEGAALRSALRALGPGQFMTRLRSAEGGDAWYLSGGKPEDAAQAWAWSLGSGRVIALSASGALADAGKGRTKLVELGSPHPGATYAALAAAGGIVAAAWEAGSFPEISAAGLVIAPLDP